MATQEQKDRKIEAAKKRLGNIQKKIDKANERIAAAQKVLEDQKAPLHMAQANLKWAQAMPVNGEADLEPEDVEQGADATAEGTPEPAPVEQQPAFI